MAVYLLCIICFLNSITPPKTSGTSDTSCHKNIITTPSSAAPANTSSIQDNTSPNMELPVFTEGEATQSETDSDTSSCATPRSSASSSRATVAEDIDYALAGFHAGMARAVSQEIFTPEEAEALRLRRVSAIQCRDLITNNRELTAEQADALKELDNTYMQLQNLLRDSSPQATSS